MNALLALLLLLFLVPASEVVPSSTGVVGFSSVLLLVALLYLVRIGSGTMRGPLPQQKYVLLIVVAYTLSEAQYLWFGGTVKVLLFWSMKALFFLGLVSLARDARTLVVLSRTVVVALLFLLWKAWTLFLHHPEMLPFQDRIQSVGNYNHPNTFALLLTTMIPVVYALVETERGLLKRVFLLGLVIVMGVTVLFTKSRGGLLGLCAAIVYVMFTGRKLVKSASLRIAATVAIVAVIIGYGTAVVMTRRDVTGLFGGAEASSGDRLLAWIAGFQMFAAHPFIGVGWEHFKEEIYNYGFNRPMIAHNTLISVLAETGLFGISCFLMILYHTMRNSVRVIRDQAIEEGARLLTQGFFGALCVFLVDSVFSVKDHEPTYWTILGLNGAAQSILLWRAAPAGKPGGRGDEQVSSEGGLQGSAGGGLL